MTVKMITFVLGITIAAGAATARAQPPIQAPVLPSSELRHLIAVQETLTGTARVAGVRQPMYNEPLRQRDILRELPAMILPGWHDAVRQQRIDRHIRSAA